MSKVKKAIKPVYCVYVAVGQKISAVSRVASLLKRENCFFFSVIVAATASEPASLQYLAPYTGCAIGEWFRDRLANALVIYDDLSAQATAYRQIALLLRRPPGREAYPGDIFYLHSRLLERAGKLTNNNNISSSLTVLPIVETFDGEISAFIPTNVISITDGQIYLDPTLFHNGFTPAVSFKLSVSRVGSNAQLKAIKKLAFSLKNVILSYQELASFSAIEASAVPQYIRTVLIKGSQVSLTLQQEQAFQHILQTQYFSAQAALSGVYNRVKKSHYAAFKDFLLSHFYIDNR
jgi:F-type H+-transporting ATPase subunit alpha